MFRLGSTSSTLSCVPVPIACPSVTPPRMTCVTARIGGKCACGRLYSQRSVKAAELFCPFCYPVGTLMLSRGTEHIKSIILQHADCPKGLNIRNHNRSITGAENLAHSQGLGSQGPHASGASSGPSGTLANPKTEHYRCPKCFMLHGIGDFPKGDDLWCTRGGGTTRAEGACVFRCHPCSIAVDPSYDCGGMCFKCNRLYTCEQVASYHRLCPMCFADADVAGERDLLQPAVWPAGHYLEANNHRISNPTAADVALPDSTVQPTALLEMQSATPNERSECSWTRERL